MPNNSTRGNNVAVYCRSSNKVVSWIESRCFNQSPIAILFSSLGFQHHLQQRWQPRSQGLNDNGDPGNEVAKMADNDEEEEVVIID